MAKRGMSLVEVLVVLVVLVLGIFGVALLFPSGFGSIRFTENTTTAQSLARANEEYFRARAANLMEGILALRFNPNLGLMVIDPTADPTQQFNQLTFADTDKTGPGNAVDPRYSGPNRWRHVEGEVVRIPPPSIDSPYYPNAGISLYTLTLGPIYSVQAIPTSSMGVVVYSATPLRQVVLGNPPQGAGDNDAVIAQIGNQASYGINYDLKKLYFRAVLPGEPNANDPAFQNDRHFRLQYSYVQQVPNGGSVHSSFVVPDIDVPWLAAGNPPLAWREIDIPPPPGFQNWDPSLRLELDSIQVARDYVDVSANNNPFSSVDPFQYRVLQPWVGIIGFNPLATDIPDPYGTGRGLTAKIDYDVDDWHILRQDVTVPQLDPTNPTTSATRTVKLPGAPILQVGDTEDTTNLVVNANGGGVVGDSFDYSGLMRSYQFRRSPTDGIDLVVADLSTGLTIDSSTLGGAGNSSNGNVDYRAGLIRFNSTVTWNLPVGAQGPAPTTPIAGRHIRVYYRTTAEWGVAVQKPYGNYVRDITGALPVGYNNFIQGPAGFIYLPATDGAKSVLVDYRWRQVQCDANNQSNGEVTRTQVGELHRITEPDDLNNLSGSGNWWVRTDNHESAGPDPPVPAGCPTIVPGSIQILGVRGASLTSRIFWREGKTWHHLDQDAILTRESK